MEIKECKLKHCPLLMLQKRSLRWLCLTPKNLRYGNPAIHVGEDECKRRRIAVVAMAKKAAQVQAEKERKEGSHE